VNLFRKRPGPWDPQERFNGLSGADFSTLARYNAERARGIMHTPEWQAEMAAFQSRFDAAERERQQH
jgi:hypothetical protein